MKTVYKYKLEKEAHATDLNLPFGAQVLSAKEQYGDVCIWAAVDTGIKVTVPRRFVTVGTGHIVPPHAYFIDTVMLMGGSLVVHVFEVKA